MRRYLTPNTNLRRNEIRFGRSRIPPRVIRGRGGRNTVRKRIVGRDLSTAGVCVYTPRSSPADDVITRSIRKPRTGVVVVVLLLGLARLLRFTEH